MRSKKVLSAIIAFSLEKFKKQMKEKKPRTPQTVQAEFDSLNGELIDSQKFFILLKKFGAPLVNEWLQAQAESNPFPQNFNKKRNRRTQKPILIEERFQDLQKQTEDPDIRIAKLLYSEYPVSIILEFLIDKK